MLKHLLLLLFCVSLFPAAALAQTKADDTSAPGPITDEQKPAVDAAQKWLATIDAGHYSESWQEASASFRKAVTDKDWATSLTSFRKPLGALVSRTPTKAKSLTSLAGAPDGTYVVMEFAASFANKKQAYETVAVSREADGAWRAVGYFIR